MLDNRNIAVASDHGGVELKELLVAYLIDKGLSVTDCGIALGESSDYPDSAAVVVSAILNAEVSCGILVCGTGLGMSITANRVPGIRAALCADEYTARMSRAHNDANVLCLGARVIGSELAKSIVDAWLATSFDGGRHERRVCKIESVTQSIINGEIK